MVRESFILKKKSYMEETNIRKVLGKFYGIPRVELKTHLYLNVKEKCNKQCRAGSYHTMQLKCGV